MQLIRSALAVHGCVHGSGSPCELRVRFEGAVPLAVRSPGSATRLLLAEVSPAERNRACSDQTRNKNLTAKRQTCWALGSSCPHSTAAWAQNLHVRSLATTKWEEHNRYEFIDGCFQTVRDRGTQVHLLCPVHHCTHMRVLRPTVHCNLLDSAPVLCGTLASWCPKENVGS